MLIRVPDRVTGLRAPGPGPLKKVDWKPIFEEHLALYFIPTPLGRVSLSLTVLLRLELCTR